MIKKYTFQRLAKVFVPIIVIGFIISAVYRLSSQTPSLPFIPLPFSSTNVFPSDRFLFIALDEYFNCSEDLCNCVVSEYPIPSFEFRDDKLLVDRSPLSAPDTDDWETFRKQNNSVLLYSKYSLWDVKLQLFSTIPTELPGSAITVLGINPTGDVNIKFKNDYVIIPVGQEYTQEKLAIQGGSCLMTHAYTITNYGFVQDKNVEFFPEDRWDF
jgi:hypothetical protein